MATFDLASLFKHCSINTQCCESQSLVGKRIISDWRAGAQRELDFYLDYAARTDQDPSLGPITISMPAISMIVDVGARRKEIDDANARAIEYLSQLTGGCIKFALNLMGG
jgi:hypothetical protein